MKISYLVTCHNETSTLRNLLDVLVHVNENDKCINDEVVILIDSPHNHGEDINKETSKIIYNYTGFPNVIWTTHALNKNYAEHKNFGIEHCDGDWIFQIDGDEMPPESLLGENLHALLEANPTVDAYAIPRLNDFVGGTVEDAKRWGWSMEMSPTTNRPKFAWPDHQFRLFKNCPEIRFRRPLHERIDGYKNLCILPYEDETYAIHHIKTMEKQNETNMKYNKDFSANENMGNG